MGHREAFTPIGTLLFAGAAFWTPHPKIHEAVGLRLYVVFCRLERHIGNSQRRQPF